jgi:hypothetical protein
MTCRDHALLWNACLDEPSCLTPDRRRELDAHEASCPSCQRIGAAFRILTDHLPAPTPPTGLSDRVIAAWEGRGLGEGVAPTLLGWRTAYALAACAAAAIPVAFFLRGWTGRDPAPARPIARISPARPWNVALADTASATLDLARETSAPVARIGKDALVASRWNRGDVPADVAAPRSAETLVDEVSRRVNAGIRPLGGTAKRAFSFLSAPSPPTRVRSPGDSGA